MKHKYEAGVPIAEPRDVLLLISGVGCVKRKMSAQGQRTLTRD